MNLVTDISCQVGDSEPHMRVMAEASIDEKVSRYVVLIAVSFVQRGISKSSIRLGTLGCQPFLCWVKIQWIRAIMSNDDYAIVSGTQL